MGNRSKYRGNPTVPFNRQQQAQGGVPLDKLAAMRAQQEAAVRARVEGLAAAIYAQNVDLDSYDCPDDGFAAHCSECSQASVDAALNFAREVWGIQGQRVAAAQPVEGAEPPSPIIEG